MTKRREVPGTSKGGTPTPGSSTPDEVPGTSMGTSMDGSTPDEVPGTSMGDRHARLLADDAAGRRAAQSEYRQPVVLEAGAGTGKTTTLVARILGWCLGAGWEEAVATAESVIDNRSTESGIDKRTSEAVGDQGPASQDGFNRVALQDSDEGPKRHGSDHGSPLVTSERIAATVLQGLVSITFTEAAAAEMASRIAAALALVAEGREDQVVGLDLEVQPAPPPAAERAGRARALLGNLDHLTATTIHAFCLNLLVQHPLEAGVHPNLTIDADGAMVEETVHEVLEQLFAAAWSDDDPRDPLLGLAAAGIGPEPIAAAAVLLSSHGMPAGALGADPLGGETVDRLAAALLAAVNAVDAQLLPEIHALKGAALAPRVAAALDATRAFLETTPLSGLAGATQLRDFAVDTWADNLVKHLAKWSKNVPGVKEAPKISDPVALGEACRDLEPLLSHIRGLDPALLDLGRRALAPLLRDVEVSLRSRGIATFSFLLAAARDLLAGNGPLRRRLRRRMRQLLVDEFQDTDGLQCDIIRHLALEGPADERPGLFLVGDPKQSIYGWRSADLAAYDEFKAAVVDGGGAVYGLHRNFRSVAAVLAEVERVVEPVMVEATAVQPRFAPLLVSPGLEDDPGFTAGGRLPVEHWVSWVASEPGEGDSHGPKTLADAAAALEASAIAADIRDLHDHHAVDWGRFGLLFRSTSRIDTYLSALRDAGVPFAVTKDKHYYRRREVIEAAALLRAIVSPVDHLALVTYLRSPSAGLPDAALLPLWRGNFPARMTALRDSGDAVDRIAAQVRQVATSLPSNIPGLDRIPDWPESVVAAIRNLAILRRAYTVEPADLFLDRVRRLVLLEATEAGRYLGPYRLANLDRFFRGVEQTMAERSGNVRASLRAIHRKVREAREEEEARPKDSVDDAVQVMTIHAAKGLEYEHVFLVGAHSGSRGGSVMNDFDERWHPAVSPEYRLFGAPTLDFHRVEARRQRVAAAEQVRTLYVALTRACRRLVVLGKWPESPTPKNWEDAKDHLQLLQSRTDLPDSIGELWEACLASGESSITRDGVRWVFPGLAPAVPVAPATPGATTTTIFPTEMAIVRIADLGIQRREAAERMQRPFSGTPSGHHEDRPGAALDEAPASPPTGTDTIARQAALAAGTAIHTLLETWNPTAEISVELERRRETLDDLLPSDLDTDLRHSTVVLMTTLVDRLAAGTLLPRLVELAPKVVARELPMIVAPGADDEATGFLSGLIDLLYRDPETGQLVIVDFKTDRTESDADLEGLRERYGPQLEIYRRAVTGFYPQEPPPRCELWILWADRILEL